ncbi:MAG: mismatch repair protein MutT [Verrucomicrobiaceae bacterium]|nr:mismatch repair protein MutT [Verrucomicrobiaceae bacterium]
MSEKKIPEQVGPWQRVSTRQVYENPWVSVTHEEVITPAGTDGIYGVIHFKTRAIGIIPIDADGYTWLVRQFRYTLNQHLWEIPMGGGKLHDEPLAAAQRELQEETGFIANDWREIMRLHISKSVTDEEGVVFVARELTAGAAQLEHSEADLEVLRLPLTEAIQWALDGKITDVISCAGLLKLHVLMQTGAL